MEAGGRLRKCPGLGSQRYAAGVGTGGPKGRTARREAWVACRPGSGRIRGVPGRRSLRYASPPMSLLRFLFLR